MENAGTSNCFESYKLSECTLDRIRLLREPLKENIARANPSWANIFGKANLEPDTIDESSGESDESVTINEDPQMINVTINQFSQFYATQCPLNLYENEKPAPKEKCDIALSLYESLEYASGKLNFKLMESLSEDELISVTQELERKISSTGLCNLCKSINSSSIEERTRYAPVLLTHLVLPQIVHLERPPRLLLSTVVETVQLCPDDICTFIFTPLLNLNLQDTVIITTIVNAFGTPRKANLIREFCNAVSELQPWHIQLLQELLSTKVDDGTHTKLIQLFLSKAADFSKDMSFGKLLLLFMKTNGTLVECHRDSLWDIINAHETVFKKPLMNILDRM